MLAGTGEQALRDALGEVRGPLDDAMGALGPVLDALPEEFPELPVDLPASDCPYVNALRDALARQLAGAGNALGNAGTALGAANSMFEQARSEEHTSELQSLMRISYAVFCLKKKNRQ